MSEEFSIAHCSDINYLDVGEYPDGCVPWRPAEPPDINSEHRSTGRLRGCSCCGSMHPADVADAIRAGAKFRFADMKYGWPHKVYGRDIPNPHAGMLEVLCTSSSKSDSCPREVRYPHYDEDTGARLPDRVWFTEIPKPARETTEGKFYTRHLLDASPEDRRIIEKHLNIKIKFEDGKVSWRALWQRTEHGE